MRLLNEAWAVLKDPDRRATYDAAHGGPPVPSKPPTSHSPSAWKRGAGQPAWTGAAGQPPGRPWGFVLDFGIYAGWSLGEVARRDRGYLMWLRDRPEGRPHRTEIDSLLEPRNGENEGQDGDSRRGKRSR